MRICQVKDCDKRHAARGYCANHYQQLWASRHSQRCSFEGCTNAKHAHGLCAGHLYQRNKGQELRPLSKQERSICSVDGCEKLSITFGFCRIHHYRWKANGDPTLTRIASKGRGCTTKAGYRQVVVDSKAIFEHRWVMEQHIGRELYAHERVHHKNGDRADNRIENLELWTVSHPPGQRVEEKVAWAKELLRLYEPEALVT